MAFDDDEVRRKEKERRWFDEEDFGVGVKRSMQVCASLRF